MKGSFALLVFLSVFTLSLSVVFARSQKLDFLPETGLFLWMVLCLCVSLLYFSSSSSAPFCLVSSRFASSSVFVVVVLFLLLLLGVLFRLPAFPFQKAIWCRARS